MTIQRMFTIICDECGIDESDSWLGHFKSRLKNDGWKFGNKDICPTCQDNDAQEQETTE